MLQFERTRTAGLAWPILLTGAIAAFALRNRDVAGGASPGSGATIAVSEIVSRLPALAHSAVAVGDRAVLLLFRAAIAPANVAFSTLESEFRFGLRALTHLAALLHSVSFYLLHTT
jgi:hypothetical protein